jgi:hypothetical protein
LPVVIASHLPLDAAHPVLVTLIPAQPITSEGEMRVKDAVDLFAGFCRSGGFPAVNNQTAALVAFGNSVEIALEDLPADASTLGVLGRMLLSQPEIWVSINVKGTPATDPKRALDPLAMALFKTPSLRQPLSLTCEMDPGTKWYCLEATRHGEWNDGGLAVLQQTAELWIAVCQNGGMSNVEASFRVRAGGAAMNEPQVGADFWAAQVAALELDFGAPCSLVNLIDQASRNSLGLAQLAIT